MVLLVTLLVAGVACGGPGTGEASPVALPTGTPAPSPAWTATVRPTSTPLPPTPVPTATPTPLPPLAGLDVLPTVTPQPAVAPTPFPDAEEIVDAVLGQRPTRHWVAHLTEGSFTAPGAGERLALVGNIGEREEMRWVVVGQEEDGWRLLGTSEWLGSGFDAPSPAYLAPELLDFDGDGRQEVVSYYFRMHVGWITAAEGVYRWDGQALARVWGATTGLDNRMAERQDAPQPYREEYGATWEMVDLNGDGVDEIRLQERVAYTVPGEAGYVEDGAPSIGEAQGERAFRWDGEAFRPYAPEGPVGPFAYATPGDLWLWEDRSARPLGVARVGEFRWSPDGGRIAWWAQPFAGVTAQRSTLGVYEVATGTRRVFALDGAPATLGWAPDGRLVYGLPDGPPALLDPETGRQERLPVASPGTWSPDGRRLAYEQEGDLYVHDLTTGEEYPLVVAPEDAGLITPWAFDPAWSPQGDWIACSLESLDDIYVGVISPDVAEPLDSFDLLEDFEGRESSGLQLAWSPDGAYLAALTSDPRFGDQPTVLTIGEVAPGGGDPVGRPAWREVLQLGVVTQTVRLAWAPNGERVALAAGDEMWEATAAGETALRYRFAVPGPEWTALAWAPDGSGFVVGLQGVYDGALHWFPVGEGEPVTLVGGLVGEARFPATGFLGHGLTRKNTESRD